MNSAWNNFFREERKRTFEPGPYFVQRVMARLAPRKAQTLWDVVPDAMRPVMAVAFTLLFAVLAVQILTPAELPARGAIEAYLGQDLTSRERMLFTDPQATTGAAQFEELMLLEPEQ